MTLLINKVMNKKFCIICIRRIIETLKGEFVTKFTRNYGDFVFQDKKESGGKGVCLTTSGFG